MKRVICILIALVFVSGCALSTIRAPKRKKSEPVRSVTTERNAPKPRPRSLFIKQKEEILSLEKENIK